MKSFDLPTQNLPEVVAWSPDEKSIAVAAHDYGVVNAADNKLLLANPQHDQLQFKRLLWSSNGKELGILLYRRKLLPDRTETDGSSELWRVSADGKTQRRVSTDVLSFGWGPELIYIKAVTGTANRQVTFLAVDDPEAAVYPVEHNEWSGQDPILWPEIGCYPTALSADVKCLLGRFPDDPTFLNSGVMRVCRIDVGQRKILWQRDVSVGDTASSLSDSTPGVTSGYYNYDRIEWSEPQKTAAISLGYGTDAGGPRSLVLVSSGQAFEVKASDGEIYLISDPQWAVHFVTYAEIFMEKKASTMQHVTAITAFDPKRHQRRVLTRKISNLWIEDFPLAISRKGRLCYVQPAPSTPGADSSRNRKWLLKVIALQ